MKSMVLVGNGPSLRGNALGRKIDACDEVVRFTKFVTAGYEVDVGSRMTIWATYIVQCRTLPSELHHILFTGYGIQDPTLFDRRHADIQGLYPGRTITRVREDHVEGTYAEMGITPEERQAGKKPTSGLVVLYWMRQVYGDYRILVCGFDGYLPNAPTHYYDTGNSPSGLTKVLPEKERAYMRRLIDAGEVEVLQ